MTRKSRRRPDPSSQPDLALGAHTPDHATATTRGESLHHQGVPPLESTGPANGGTTRADFAPTNKTHPQAQKSSYHLAAPDDGRLHVRVEFVVMDGPEGQALGQRQADAMRKVLRWISQRDRAGRQT
jgi:hypothetical protein